MIRNLKVPIFAGLVLAMFGTLAVYSAQAAEFHSDLAETKIIVKTDGTVKTAHQVFDAPGGGTVTCAGVSGEGLVKAATAASIEVTLKFEQNCTFLGAAAEVDTTNCVFGFTAGGEVELKGVGCKLAATASGCEISFTTPKTYKGITYHNINTEAGATVEGTATYTTVSAALSGIEGKETGASCLAPGAFTNGEFTTGNAIVEGVVPNPMTNIWWTA